MIRKYKIKMNFNYYTFDTLNEAIEVVKLFDNAAENLDITIMREEVEGDPTTEAVRTGLNDDYPDNL
jgi:hypothetical protein